MISSILKVPGIEKMTPGFLRTLAYIAEKNGFNVDGIAGVISHESRFNPAAKNPHGSASGLIQFIESTAEMLGTTTAALRAMTAVAQLIYVERYFQRFMPVRPTEPAGYILATYGRGDLANAPDETPIDRRDSPDPAERNRYAVNAGLDRAGDGVITVGDLRASMAGVLGAAKGQRIPVPPAEKGDGGGFLVVAGVAALAVAAWAVRRFK